MSTTTPTTKSFKMENHIIGFVPLAERHGHPRVLFPMWFAINLAVITMVLGSVGVFSGLNLAWSAVAIVLGNAVGAVFMALHSVQGPRIGTPQMIQSRAQFGVDGAAYPLILIVLMYIGYASANAVVGAQAITAVTPIPVSPAIVIVMTVTAVVVLIGYDLIHKVQTLLSIVNGLFFLTLTVIVVLAGFPAGAWSLDGFQLVPFLLMVGIAGTWQLTYAPYVADYSRYLPADTSERATFGYTYSGTVIGGSWLMMLGACVAVSAPQFFENTTQGLIEVMGEGWTWAIVTSIVVGVTLGNAVNLYGCFITTSTILSTWVKVKFTQRSRVVIVACCSLVVTLIAVLGYGSFVESFSSFVNFLAYLIFPWTSINLADYFLVRRGRYDVPSFYDRSRQYGSHNLNALLPYALTVLVSIPFIDTTVYRGFIAEATGIDAAWIIAIVLPAALYVPLERRRLRRMRDAEVAIG